jgi:hypothetical protein
MIEFKQVLFVEPERKINFLICLNLRGIFDPMRDAPGIFNTAREQAQMKHVALSAVAIVLTDDVDVYYFADLYTEEEKRAREQAKLGPKH